MRSVKKLLCLHAGALGDLVNTLPALHALRRHYPGAKVHALGNASILSLFHACKVIDSAHSLDAQGMHALFAEGPLPEGVRKWLAGFDLFVSWMRDPVLVSHLDSFGAGVSVLEGPFPPGPGQGHVVEVMARPVLELGIRDVPPEPRLDLPVEIVEQGPVFRGVLVHPGSGSIAKNWPAERFAQAAERIADAAGLEIGVLEGPADHAAAMEALSRLCGRSCAHFTGLSYTGLAALLSGAGVVLGNDSGVSHLAGALGTRVVAVSGPTDPETWGVRQENAINIGPGQAPCAPCDRETMRECGSRKCLESISVDRVVETVLRFEG